MLGINWRKRKRNPPTNKVRNQSATVAEINLMKLITVYSVQIVMVWSHSDSVHLSDVARNRPRERHWR